MAPKDPRLMVFKALCNSVHLCDSLLSNSIPLTFRRCHLVISLQEILASVLLTGSLPCGLSEPTCHVGEAYIAGNSGLPLTDSMKLRLSVQQPKWTGSCKQPHKWAWKNILPQVSLRMSPPPKPSWELDCSHMRDPETEDHAMLCLRFWPT